MPPTPCIPTSTPAAYLTCCRSRQRPHLRLHKHSTRKRATSCSSNAKRLMSGVYFSTAWHECAKHIPIVVSLAAAHLYTSLPFVLLIVVQRTERILLSCGSIDVILENPRFRLVVILRVYACGRFTMALEYQQLARPEFLVPLWRHVC